MQKNWLSKSNRTYKQPQRIIPITANPADDFAGYFIYIKSVFSVVKDKMVSGHDDNGIIYFGIERFLLDETAMDK